MPVPHGDPGDHVDPVDPVDSREDVEAAEAWFVGRGLPYFVDSERAAVHRGLRRRRLVTVLVAGGLVAAAVGALVGWLARDASLALPVALQLLSILAMVYAAVTLRAWLVVRWAVRRTLGSLGLLFPLVTRALPLLLLFITFLFVNAEVWQVSSTLDGGVMWLAVLLFAGVAVGFLMVRLPEELDRFDRQIDVARLVSACRGTPLEAAARSFVERHGNGVEVADDTVVRGLQKANLMLVLLIAQAVQVLLLATAVFVFFIVFGMVAVDREVVASWLGHDPAYPFGIELVSRELVQVSVFLAAFSGLYFTVYAVNDETYREQFFTGIVDELERAVSARAVYQAMRRRFDAA